MSNPRRPGFDPYEQTIYYGTPAPPPPPQKAKHRFHFIFLSTPIILLVLAIGVAGGYLLAQKKSPPVVKRPTPTLSSTYVSPSTAVPVIYANSVNISDKANVLDSDQVRNAAHLLSYRVDIYTVAGYKGSNAAFDQEARSKAIRDSIVIAMNTTPNHVAIVGGNNVSRENTVYQNAVNAFVNGYKTGSYTGATVAALQSMETSLQK